MITLSRLVRAAGQETREQDFSTAVEACLALVLERIPVTFEHSPRAERSSCILVG